VICLLLSFHLISHAIVGLAYSFITVLDGPSLVPDIEIWYRYTEPAVMQLTMQQLPLILTVRDKDEFRHIIALRALVDKYNLSMKLSPTESLIFRDIDPKDEESIEAVLREQRIASRRVLHTVWQRDPGSGNLTTPLHATNDQYHLPLPRFVL
jgi:hypothetical protein